MHHSLVFFTVICQTAVGAFIFRELFSITIDDFQGYGKERKSLNLIIGLLFIALCISFFHLGKPVNSVNALNNIKSSWLSREILFLICSGSSIIIYSFTDSFRGPGWFRNIIRIVSVLSSMLLLFSMIRLYMIPGVPSWNNPHTPAAFILTSLSCGLSFISAFSNLMRAGAKKIILLLTIFIVAAPINSMLYNSLSFKQLPLLVIIRVFLSFTAILIISINYFVIFPNKKISWPVIVFIIVTASEVINRYIFFLSFEKSGL